MKIGNISLITAILLGSLSTSLSAGEDLGVVTVESSTVSVVKSSATEVSKMDFIDNAQIQDIAPRHINELLQTIPGITSDVRAGEVVEIHIRGVGGQEFMWEDTSIAVIVDGVPLFQNGGKIRLNMSDIKSVKVIKGGASYLYGNTALAGAVIITTHKPRNKDEISLGVEAGSHDYRNYNLGFLKSTENFSIDLKGNYRTTDGYWVDSELENKSVSGKFSYFIDDTSDITLGVDKTQKYEQSNRASVTGVTEAETTPEGNGRNSWQKDNDVELDKYFITYNKDFSNDSNLMVNIYNFRDQYDYISSPQDTTGDGDNDTYSNHTTEDLKQRGLKLEFKQERDSFAYMLGGEYGNRDYLELDDRLIDYTVDGSDYYAGESSDVQNDQIRYGLYGEIKYSFTPDFTATFNVRHDIQNEDYAISAKDYDGTTWSYVDTKRDKTFNETSYRIGATYKLSDTTSLYSGISTGFRTPTVDQLFAGDIKGSSRGSTYYNNENIKTQTSINYEIGLRGKTPILDNTLTYDVSIFQIDNKDIIGKNDGTYYSGSSIWYDNVGATRNRGMELSLKSDASKTLSFNLAYTYLTSEYTRHDPFIVSLENSDPVYDITGNEVPRTPNHMIDLYATYNATSDLKFISEIYAKSDYYADETNLVKIGGYAVLNLQARYNAKIQAHKIEFFAKVNNVLDNQYYRTVFLFSDRNDDNVLDAEDASITVDPGREFYAGMNYRF